MILNLLDWLILNWISILSIASIIETFNYLQFNSPRRRLDLILWGMYYIFLALFTVAIIIMSSNKTNITLIGILMTSICFLIEEIPPLIKKVFAILIYIVAMCLLLLFIEAAKSNANTWGNSSLMSADVMITLIIPWKHLIRKLHAWNKGFGMIDVTFGLCSIIIISIMGFGFSEYNGESETQARVGVAILSISLVMEGVLLMYINKLNELFKYIKDKNRWLSK